MVDLSIAMLVYQRVCHFFWQMDMTPQITTKIGKWWWFLGVNLMFFPWSINWVAILLGQFFCRNIVGKLEMAPVLSFLSSLTTPLPTSWLVDFSIIGWESAIPLLISYPSYNSYNSLLMLCIHIYIHTCMYIYMYIYNTWRYRFFFLIVLRWMDYTRYKKATCNTKSNWRGFFNFLNWAGSSPLSRGACVAFAVRSGSGAALFGATLLGAVGQQQKKCCLEDPKAAQSIELDRNFGCFNIEIFRDSPIDLGDLGVPWFQETTWIESIFCAKNQHLLYTLRQVLHCLDT